MDAAVTLLEADQVGGTNLNRGPAPVRTMARSARLARDWTSWSVFGLEGPPPRPNLQAILANSDRVARHVFEKKHLADQLRRHGINLVEHLGPVQFTDPHTLTAGDGRSWRADRIILAVGGHAGPAAHPRKRAGPHLQRHPNPQGLCPRQPPSSALPTRDAKSLPSSLTSAAASACSRRARRLCRTPTSASRPNSIERFNVRASKPTPIRS